MVSNKFLFGILGLLFLLSVSQAQDVLSLPDVPLVPSPNVTDAPATLTASVQEASSQSACFYADTPGTYTLTGDLTGTKADGICITINANDVTIDCNGYSITGFYTGYGIASSNVQNVTITDCTISNYDVGIYLAYTDNSHLTNNVIYNTYYGGFYLPSSSNNVLTNNVAHDSTYYGFYTSSSSYNYFEENTAYNNGYSFFIDTSSDAEIIDNTVHDSTYGFYLYGSPYNYLEGNTAYNNEFASFLVYYSPDNILYDNNAYNNTRVGFYVVYSDNADISLATTQESQYGFYIRGSNNVNLASSTSHSNHYDFGTAYGLYIIGPGTVDITDMHLYNQSAGSNSDFGVVSYYPTTVSIQNMTIDSSQGNFENYTRLNIYDAVDDGTNYIIKWSAQPAALPPFYNSFEQKFVQISGSTVIDAISWHWLDSEIPGYNENNLELWKHNAADGWTNTNAVLNANANYLSLTNMNPASTYGILESVSAPPTDTCKVIDSPGSYQLSSNVVGAPNTFGSDSPGYPKDACIVIASSNVDFSCNGYSITNNGTTNTTGVVINSSSNLAYTNVTIRDCAVSGYDYGVLTLRNSDFNKLIDNTAYNNKYGFYLYVSDYNILTDNTVHDNALRGFELFYSADNTLINNTAYDSVVAFDLPSSSYLKQNNALINNTVARATNGFSVYGTHSRFIGNTVLQTTNAGFWNYGSYNVFEDNFVDAAGYSLGINLGSGSYNNVTNNRVQNASHAFYTAGTGNRFINNIAQHRSGPSSNTGFSAYQDTDSVFINNTATNVPIGFQTWGSTNIIISNTELYDNSRYGLLIRTPKVATISNVFLHNNGQYDLYVDNYATGATNTILNMSNMIIDSHAGYYQNYASFIINDDLTVGDWYYMSWGQQITPPPTHFSFEQKYVEITPLHLPTSISMIRWVWNVADVSSGDYDESKFELWRYNGIEWSNVSGQMLDTTNNYIELSDYTLEHPSAPYKHMYYAILQNNNSAPSVTIESPADNTNTHSTDLNYTVSDVNIADCWYYLDNAGPIALPGCANVSLGPLGDGPHNITLVVTDTFGEQTSVTVYFVFDATQPTVSIQSPINSTYFSATPIAIDLDYTVSDNFGVDSCWYYLNGTGPTALPGCTNITLPALSEGQYNVSVYVKDTAGNIDSDVVYFKVQAGCALLEVVAVDHIVSCKGKGGKSTKEPLVGISICAFNKSVGSCVDSIGVSHLNYQEILDNCQPVACAKTDAEGVALIPLPEGDYVVIGNDATKTVLSSPIGVSASDFVCTLEENQELTWEAMLAAAAPVCEPPYGTWSPTAMTCVHCPTGPTDPTCPAVMCSEGIGVCDADGQTYCVPLSECEAVTCGNGVIDPDEVCDPTADPNGCNANETCSNCEACVVSPTVCGNGIWEPEGGEYCDASAPPNETGCLETFKCNKLCTDCIPTVPVCGDGYITYPEQCDIGLFPTSCKIGTTCNNKCYCVPVTECVEGAKCLADEDCYDGTCQGLIQSQCTYSIASGVDCNDPQIVDGCVNIYGSGTHQICSGDPAKGIKTTCIGPQVNEKQCTPDVNPDLIVAAYFTSSKPGTCVCKPTELQVTMKKHLQQITDCEAVQTAPDNLVTILLVTAIGAAVALAAFERSRRIKKKRAK